MTVHVQIKEAGLTAMVAFDSEPDEKTLELFRELMRQLAKSPPHTWESMPLVEGVRDVRIDNLTQRKDLS